jgi:DUF1680 family protein
VGAISTPAASASAPRTAELREVSHANVRLEPSVAARQLEQTHAVLMGLSEDALLRPFRARAGQPAGDVELGGWYDNHNSSAGWIEEQLLFAPGHAFGQWLSALSRYFAATHDPATRGKIDRLVEGYAAAVEPTGKFYQGHRFPAYTFDKIVRGLLDAHELAHCPTALAALARATDAAWPYLPNIPRVDSGRGAPHPALDTDVSWDEAFTIPENLFRAFRLTRDPRYLALAKANLDEAFYGALARGENVLPGRHAYSHVNALGSAVEAYAMLGDEKYLRAAMHGFAFMREQSFATGAWGPDEHFVTPHRGELGDSLSNTHSFETPCGSYAHLKLARALLSFSKDARYGDSMEQVIFNTVLGASTLEPNGRTFYYSDYTRDGQKVYHPDKWPCCSGTLPEVAADYGINAYLRDRAGLYVNLYMPSTIRWIQDGSRVELSQTGSYPTGNRVSFELKAARPTKMTLNFRIPEWADDGARLSVNGQPVSEPICAGSFAVITRTWKQGDRIDLELPMPVRLVPVDAEHPNTVALMVGPLVLFGVGDRCRDLTREQLLSVHRVDGSEFDWQVDTSAGPAVFRPFFGIASEPYTTYFTPRPTRAEPAKPT